MAAIKKKVTKGPTTAETLEPFSSRIPTFSSLGLKSTVEMMVSLELIFDVVLCSGCEVGAAVGA